MPIYPKDSSPQIEIEDPEIKQLAEHVLSEVKLSVIKGIAHKIDVRNYPLHAEDGSLEKLTINYIDTLTPEKQNNAKKSIKPIVDQPVPYMNNLFRPLRQIDLTSERTVNQQVKDLNLDSNIKLKYKHLKKLRIINNKIVSRIEPVAETPYITHPIIFQPPFTLVDPIDNKYLSMKDVLGDPVGSRGVCPDGKGRYQHYEHGSIYWSPKSGAHEIHGAIHKKWKTLGWETSILGYPVTDELTTPDGDGRYNHFEGGSIYWTPTTGANEVHGAIRSKWATMGWEKSYLGYPKTDERKTPDTIGRYNHFEGGSIYWTPATGAHAVHNNIKTKWEENNWERGYLGYPINDTVIFGSENQLINTNQFQGGQIQWSSTSGAFDSMPVSKLRFRIHKVRCIDDTDYEWGSDEIDFGGVACSINNGETTKISAFRVSSDFDDGEQVVYNPPKDFFTFDLKNIPGWPKAFIMTMALAEVDQGGFNDFLKKLLEYIRDKVVSLLSERIGGIIGGTIGAAVGAALGSAVGAIAGALIGWILGEAVNWLISLFEDDVFPIWTAKFELPTVYHQWGTDSDSPDYSFQTRAHGGKYQVWFDWELLG